MFKVVWGWLGLAYAILVFRLAGVRFQIRWGSFTFVLGLILGLG